MTPSSKTFFSRILHGSSWGIGFFITVCIASVVYAATTYYPDLPATAAPGGLLTADSWNNLVNYANKAVKQDVETVTITGSNVGIGTTNPSQKLEVSGGDAVINGVRIGLGGGNVATNTAVGTQALSSNTTGTGNTANGTNSLLLNTSGYSNTANGAGSLYSNTTGVSNTANGINALHDNSTGSYNTANGAGSLRLNTIGYSNTANGINTLRSNISGYNNTANGATALYSNTSGYFNTANGVQSLYSNTTGSHNTGYGMNALMYNTTGTYNTANGVNGLYSNTIGVANTSVWVNSLWLNTTGTYNTSLGYQSGFSGSTGAFLTGDSNTFLGANTYYTNTGITNATAVGAGVGLTNSNTVVLGYNANVGIGTTSPQGKLQVTDTTTGIGIYGKTERTTGNNYGVIGNADGAWATANIGVYAAALGGTSNKAIYIEAANPNVGANNWALYSASQAQSYFAGNVGIGTTSPTAKLEVVGNIIGSTPVNGNHLATKDYVDTKVALAAGGAPTCTAGFLSSNSFTGICPSGYTNIYSMRWNWWTTSETYLDAYFWSIPIVGSGPGGMPSFSYAAVVYKWVPIALWSVTLDYSNNTRVVASLWGITQVGGWMFSGGPFDWAQLLVNHFLFWSNPWFNRFFYIFLPCSNKGDHLIWLKRKAVAPSDSFRYFFS